MYKIKILFFILLFLALSNPGYTQSNANTSDVYIILQQIGDEISTLRKTENITGSMQTVTLDEYTHHPNHLLQKSLEIIEKLNRYRIKSGLGIITVPRFPSREITQNEVFAVVKRILGELLIINNRPDNYKLREITNMPENLTDFDYNYHVLSAFSLSLDPILGVKGFTPDDVYRLSLKIYENARFLRISQNYSLNLMEPEITTGNQPNHALQSASQLMQKVSDIEQNLWMNSIDVQKVPHRKIELNEVYQTLLGILAELQRIKYRLGLERYFPEPIFEPGKTSDDIVQMIKWANIILPNFNVNTPLVQYNPTSLEKTPSDVYKQALEINQKLEIYRNARGIRIAPRTIQFITTMKPINVYEKTLESLKKVSRLREQMNLGKLVVNDIPLREITPTEVFELAERLNDELNIILDTADLKYKTQMLSFEQLESKKTPPEAHFLMWRNLTLLDTIIGPLGYTPNDSYQLAKTVGAEIKLIREFLNISEPVLLPPLVLGKIPTDVNNLTLNILDLFKSIQERAGMFGSVDLQNLVIDKVTPNEAYNSIGVLLTEIIQFKVHQGITESIIPEELPADKNPSHVYQQMDYVKRLLATFLNLAIE